MNEIQKAEIRKLHKECRREGAPEVTPEDAVPLETLEARSKAARVAAEFFSQKFNEHPGGVYYAWSRMISRNSYTIDPKEPVPDSADVEKTQLKIEWFRHSIECRKLRECSFRVREREGNVAASAARSS